MLPERLPERRRRLLRRAMIVRPTTREVAMAEILGIGATHYPPGLVPDEYKAWPLARMLHTDPRIPERMRDPVNWPAPMRAEWGDDEGITAHKAHRTRVLSAFRKIREEIDAFRPDLIVMWGDDQY